MKQAVISLLRSARESRTADELHGEISLLQRMRLLEGPRLTIKEVQDHLDDMVVSGEVQELGDGVYHAALVVKEPQQEQLCLF